MCSLNPRVDRLPGGKISSAGSIASTGVVTRILIPALTRFDGYISKSKMDGKYSLTLAHRVTPLVYQVNSPTLMYGSWEVEIGTGTDAVKAKFSLGMMDIFKASVCVYVASCWGHNSMLIGRTIRPILDVFWLHFLWVAALVAVFLLRWLQRFVGWLLGF